MRIFQEEIFGPVVSVTAFNGYDEAVEDPKPMWFFEQLFRGDGAAARVVQ